MSEKRSRIIYLFIIGALLLSVYFLFDRMAMDRGRFVHARYADKGFIELMEQLIDEDVFRVAGGDILLDEKALEDRGLSAHTEARIKRSMPFLHVREGNLYFDRMSVSITNNRTFREDPVLRGRFLDRNGDVLASSTVDMTLWNQKREYAYGPEFYPVIGHWNHVFGKRNLEKVLDGYLTGTTHWPVYRNATEPLRKLRVGDDVVLTLDSVIQRRAYDLMRGKRGAVIVLDVKTGEVLAAVSTPSFDPNTTARTRWREAFADREARPYENRAFSVLYPPGSTFKTVVASAWTELGRERDERGAYTVKCDGGKNKYRISDVHAHGRVDLDRAFAESCNVFFSDIGVILGQGLAEYAHRFGFGSTTDLIPQKEELKYSAVRSLAFSWWDNSEGGSALHSYAETDYRQNPKIVAQVAIGQNLVMVTPLQMAMVASTIADGGVLLNPYIVKEIKTGDGKRSVFKGKPVKLRKAIERATARKLRYIMEEVMQQGTGKNVREIHNEHGMYTVHSRDSGSEVVRVAGKTGTAEVGDRNGNGTTEQDERPHSWFMGFAPSDDPRVAIAVIVENQGYGSISAAPIAMDVLALSLDRKVNN